MPAKTHGLSQTKEYFVWQAMKARCHRKTDPSYARYGGRGITVCKEWRESFEAFINDMGECPDSYCLDRIDNNKGYFKDNCRWTTRDVNNRNKRNNQNFEFNGETLCMKDLAKTIGLKCPTLKARLHYLGWSFDKAICPNKKKATDECCANGHAWTSESTYITPQGKKTCRICCRISDHKRRPATGKAKTNHLSRKRTAKGHFA